MSGFITEEEYNRELVGRGSVLADVDKWRKEQQRLEMFHKEHGYWPTPQPSWFDVVINSDPHRLRKHDIDSYHINSYAKRWVFYKMNLFWATHTWYGIKRDFKHKLIQGHGLWRKCDCRTYIWG